MSSRSRPTDAPAAGRGSASSPRSRQSAIVTSGISVPAAAASRACCRNARHSARVCGCTTLSQRQVRGSARGRATAPPRARAAAARAATMRPSSVGASHWDAPTLEGRIVRLEPLRPEHEEGLWLASRDPRTWRWLSVVQPQTRAEWSAFSAGSRRRRSRDGDPPCHDRAGRDRRLDAVPRAPARARLDRDRLDLAAPVGVGAPARTSRRSSCSCARVRGLGLPSRGAQDRRAERALTRCARGARDARSRESTASTCWSARARTATARGTAYDDDWPAVRAQLEARLAER